MTKRRYTGVEESRQQLPSPVNEDLPQLKTPAPVRFWWANRVLRWYFAPEFHHLDRVAANRPTLFVGNHSVFGVLDVMLFADGLFRERGVSLRLLADRNHFKFPVWRDLVVLQGAVLGNRANCAAADAARGTHPGLPRRCA